MQDSQTTSQDGNKTNATLPALALEIANWFPELGGRSLAVSEIESITAQNLPKLPLCCLALIREVNTIKNSPMTIKPDEEFVIEFWFERLKYTKADGSETPFYAYFDFDAVRDKLLYHTSTWTSPKGGRVYYQSLQVDVSQVASCVSFKFGHVYTWCRPYGDSDDGRPIEKIFFNLKGACAPCFSE